MTQGPRQGCYPLAGYGPGVAMAVVGRLMLLCVLADGVMRSEVKGVVEHGERGSKGTGGAWWDTPKGPNRMCAREGLHHIGPILPLLWVPAAPLG